MIVMTRAINDTVAEDSAFAKFLVSSIKRFLMRDWGVQHPQDKAMNDEFPETAMGCYFDSQERKIWIKRDYIDEDGEKTVITVLFPEEY